MSARVVKHWAEIEPLIDQLFDVPAGERAEWLRQHCADTSLRALVAQALDQTLSVEVLEQGMAQWLPALAEALPEASPDDALPAIPGYRVLRFVGAGGMASVFEAVRALPGGPQTVALKLLRLNVHDAEERRRFLREQQILARLQHPHIAQLLDAGFSPTGTPFLALEYVAGENLVAHCVQRCLAMRERLALFLNAAAAVEHAHRNLIVHRDLKPSNVLVSEDGCVKLVDFGIAKLLDGEGEPTRTESRRLTRAYAAPEQLADDAATTAIDVYALGVLLAELASGLRPRRVEERTGAEPAAFDSDKLRRKLGADLSAIVQQATRSNPLERYPSVAALRDDVQRHLDGRPLHARADAFAYRAAKFVARHALVVSASAAIALVLAGATAIGLHEAHVARTQALTASDEAQRADALKSFLAGLFDSTSRGQASQAAEVLLVRGQARAERDFATQPALRVEILALIGDLERRGGRPDLARQPLEQAAALAQRQFRPSDRRALHVAYLLAKDDDELGRVREAKAELQDALLAYQAGPDPESPEVVQALAWMAGLDERSGESSRALAMGKQALALARRILPHASAALTEAVTNLGWIEMDAGYSDRAEPLLREALARQRSRFGARHPDVADAMALLSSALLQLGRYGEGERLMRAAVSIDDAAYAGPNAHAAAHLNDLANALAAEGEFRQADGGYAQAIAMDRALAPAADRSEAVSLANVARLRFRQGDYATAEAKLRDAIDRKQRLFGADYADNGRSYDRACLAEILVARGNVDAAQPIADQALADAQQRHRDAHPDVAFALVVEAELATARGASARAAKLAGAAVAMYAALGDPPSEKAVRAHLLYGESMQALGHNVEAARQFKDALAKIGAEVRAAPALAAFAQADLARVDWVLGDRTGATRLRSEAKESLAQVEAGPNRARDAALRLLAAVRAPSASGQRP